MKEMPPSAQPPVLSPRQGQILKLLQAGKVNKEVAQELDIGLGTVKQHIVALFKKLNVSNRAMAVSRGMTLQQEQEHPGRSMTVDGLLERRPCVVLCLALPEEADPLAVRLMHGRLAELASSDDALFLARKGNAGDMIFGIQQATVYDLAIALQTLRVVHDDLLRHDVNAATSMRGCLAAGAAVVSMRRFGGWTGEAIASTAIATARELLNNTAPGFCALDSGAMDLIRVFGIGGAQDLPQFIPFLEIKNLLWTGARQAYPLVGRKNELARLKAFLRKAAKGQGCLLQVRGEMGMGKSRLCEALLAECQKKGGAGRLFRCLPTLLGNSLYEAGSAAYCSPEAVMALLRARPARLPDVLILDDPHLLSKDLQLLLSAAAIDAAGLGKMVVYAGRRERMDSAISPAEVIHLPRLDEEAVEKLVRAAMSKGGLKRQASKVKEIAGAATGVPLFAVELARQPELDSLTLPLQIVINARLDSLRLDRILLRAVAKCPASTNLREIAASLGEETESVRQQVGAMVAAGVLTMNTDGGIAFSHPLLRRAIISLIME